MRMPTRGRYELRVRMELASHFGRRPLQVEVIAQSQGVLREHIRVTVAGLMRASRGPNGGAEVASAHRRRLVGQHPVRSRAKRASPAEEDETVAHAIEEGCHG
jgi:hypothetical protein